MSLPDGVLPFDAPAGAAPAALPEGVLPFETPANPSDAAMASHETISPGPGTGGEAVAPGEALPRRAIQDQPKPGQPAWAPPEVVEPPAAPLERRALGDQPRHEPPAALEEGAQRPDVQRLGEILTWLDKNSTLEPGQAMEVARIAAASGHPAEYVAANLDEMRKAYPADGTDWQGLAEAHPDLAHYILADPVRFALARDPSADLHGIADQIAGRLTFENIAPPGYPRLTRPKYVPAPWMAILRDAVKEQEIIGRETAARVVQKTEEQEVGDRVLRALNMAHELGIDGRNPDSDWEPIWKAVGIEKLAEGEFRLRPEAPLPPPSEWEQKNAERIEELKQETRRYYGPFAQSTAGRIAFAPFRLTPPLLGGIAASTAGGLAGGPAGAVAAGAAWWTYQGYAPLAAQLEQVEGPGGKKLSPDEASRLALAFSLTGSLLMEAGVAPLMGHLAPELWTKAMGTTAAMVLTKPTLARRVGHALLALPKDVVSGAAGSAAQEAANATAVEIARASVDPSYRPSVKEIAERSGEAFVASMADMVVLGGIAAGRVFLADRGARLAAADSADRLKALTDKAAESKWFSSLPPEEAKKAVEAMKKSGGLAADEVVEHVYATLPEFDRYWQEQQVPIDPREAAREIGPETLKAYDAARAEKGTHVAIPVHEYLAKLAEAENGKHAKALANDLTLKPDVNTPRQEAAEAVLRAARARELAALPPDQMDAGQRKVFDEFKRQAMEAGEAEDVATSNAAWFSAGMSVLAERAGRGETAWDLWQVHPLNIEGPTTSRNRERAHYAQALEDYDAHPAGKAWTFLRNGRAAAGMEALDARAREQLVARGEGAVPKDLAAKIEKKQSELARLEGGEAYAADLAAKVKRGELSEAEAAKQRKWHEENADLATQKSPLRQERLAVDADPETGIQTVRPLKEGEAPGQTRPLRTPAWLKTEDFLADRQAWEWTWSATGLDAPEHLQKLVFGYMRKAFEGLEPDDIAIQQGWAVARLAMGKGGRKFEGLREKVRDWMRQPEGQRAEDPIPERAWPHLLTRTRKDTQYVSAGKYVNRKRVEVFEKWMKTTAAESSEARPTYAERPPVWFTEGDLPASKSAERALKVRRELDDLNRQAREARAEAAKIRPKLDMDETARVLGNDAKLVPTEKGGISPDELARAVGAPSGDALLRDMVERRERSAWAKREAGRRLVAGATPREAPAPAFPEASRSFTARWHAMTPEERAREFYLDRNTGILNERGFFALPPDPARPMVGHISIEGTKWLNDGGQGGHAAGDLLYRMAARALHALDPEAAKVGGDFAVRVKDQAQIDKLVARLNETMPVKGFSATGVAAESFPAAHDAHVALKQRLEASGERAARGERPRGVEAARPEDVALPVDIAAAELPESLRQAHRAMTPRQAVEAAYVEPHTGLLTAAGWNAIPRKAHQASIDLDGLKALNERLGTAGGDEVLAYFGELAREYGGLDFDVAHLHGDEYVAQSNDAAGLKGFLDTLRMVSDNVRVEVEAADGSVHEVQGIGFSAGTGRSDVEAERALVADKAARAEAGKRGPDVNAQRLRLVAEAGARSPEDLARRRDALRARREADAGGAPRQAYAGAGGAPEGVAAGRLEQPEARLVDRVGSQDAVFRLESKKKGEQGPRGIIEFPNLEPGKAAPFFIRLLDSDRSTLAHETFHAFSLIMGQLAGREDAPPELRADYERLLKVMGYGSAAERAGGRVKAKEERGSHLWEMYLAEGQAPSRELLPVFSRFRAWLRRIYQGAVGISSQYEARYGEKLALSDDAREIFGRLLAGDDAVRDASKEFQVEQPKVAFTPEEQAQSDRLWAEARAAGEAELQRQMVEEERKADRAFVREARAKLGEEAGRAVDAEPPYAAIAALTKGDVAGMEVKLDRDAVEALVGKDVAARLPKEVFGEKGVPPDAIASQLHFPTGTDLILAMAGAEPREARVKREVARLMAERYPSLQDRPRAMYEAAKGAVVGDAFLRDGIMRLRAMAREAGQHPNITDERALRAATDEIIKKKSWSGLRPDHFDAAAKKYARLAAESKDPQKRLDAYESYLWNRALYRSAIEGRATAEKVAAYLLPFTRPKGRAKLGKATETETETLPDGTVVTKTTQPYLDKVDDVLAAFEFKASATRKEVLSRAELEEWVRQRWADGDSVTIPPSIMAALERQTHWKDLTIQELTDLRDAVKSIAEQASLRSQIIIDGKRHSTDAVIGELRDAALANGAHVKLRLVDQLKTWRERMAEGGRQALHAIEQPEVLIDALDGYDPNGPWHRYYWNPLSDASYHYYDLVRTTQETIQRILRELPSTERRRLKETTFLIEGQEYNLEAAIAVGLNVGNESNETKITRGMSDPRLLENYGIQPWQQGKQTVDAFLARLTQRDVDLINAIHRALESYWPAEEALEKRDRGIAPEKLPVRPRRFIGAGGEMLQIDGGYYPVIYSGKYRVGKTQAESDALQVNGLPGLFDRTYESVITPTGQLQSRIESYARPFDLTLDALPRKLTMSAKDISFRIPAKQLYRVLMDERMIGALTQALGDKGHELLVAHLRDSVNDVMLPDPGAGIYRRAIEKLRGLAFRSTFALNVPQALQNLADPTGIAAVMPPRHFMDAALKLAKDPAAMKTWIIERSSEMRLRADGMHTLSRDLQSVFRRSELGLLWDKAGELMLVPFETTQQMTEFPTWLGALGHAIEAKEKGGLGLGEQEAVRHADGIVRRMFGGRRTVDLTPIQRDKVLRHFTMFWGWSAAQLNQFIRASRLSRRQWNQGMIAKALTTLGVTYASLAAKQVASELLVGNGPEDKDEDGKVGAGDVGRWLAFRALFTLPERLPGIGSAITSLEGGPVRDVSLTPWTNMLSAGARTLAKTVSTASDLADGSAGEDEEIALFLSWLEAGGQFVGGPSGQFRRTAHYLMDRPPDAALGEDVLGTMFGPSRPGKLSTSIYGR